MRTSLNVSNTWRTLKTWIEENGPSGRFHLGENWKDFRAKMSRSDGHWNAHEFGHNSFQQIKLNAQKHTTGREDTCLQPGAKEFFVAMWKKNLGTECRS